jgi:trimeric autotransporter adhesin
MAQDWHAAFALNADSLTINQGDFDGVNLAAIQALELRTAGLSDAVERADRRAAELRDTLTERDRHVVELRARLEAQERELLALRALVGALLEREAVRR